MRLRFFLLIITTMLLTLHCSAETGTMLYGSSSPTAELEYWGNNRIERFYVAIHVGEKELIGKKVSGLEVPLPDTEFLYGPTGFISTKLSATTSGSQIIFNPDIASIEGTIDPVTHIMSVKFPEPYEISSDGIYVGYTIEVSGATDYGDSAFTPIAITKGENTSTGLYIFTGGSYKNWTNIGQELKINSAMKVCIQGDYKLNDAIFASAGKSYGERNKETFAPISIVNCGSALINSIDYSYTMDNIETDVHYNFDTPVLNQMLVQQNVMLPVTTPDTDSDIINFKLKKVNDTDVNQNGTTVSGTLRCLTKVPVNRPLVEEFTGTWCGWCPKGIVGMEYMNNKYPDEFIGIAYHVSGQGNTDPMEMTEGYPYLTQSYPNMFINREKELDPYFGSSNNKAYGIEKDWLTEQEKFAVPEIEVYAEWANAEQTKINVKATTTFRDIIGASHNRLRVYLILVQDNLKAPTYGTYVQNWFQENYFYDNIDYANYPGLSDYLWKADKIMNMRYNDVAILTNGINPEQGVLPDNINVDIPVEITYTFDINDAVGVSPINAKLATDSEKLKVVAAVMLNTGQSNERPLNANKCSINKYNDVSMQELDKIAPVSTEWYDMQGRIVKNPKQGIYLRINTLPNGIKQTEKIVL